MTLADEEPLRQMVEAAEQARVAAPRTAVELLRRVLDALPGDDPRRPGCVAKLVTAELFTGRLRVAESLARDALEDRRFDGEARAQLSYALGQSLFLQGRLTEAAWEFGDARIKPSPAGHEPALLADAAMTRMLSGDVDAAIETAEHALFAARAVDDVIAEVAALAVLCSAYGLRAELREALDCGRAATSRADNSGVVEAHWNMPYLFLASTLLWADQVDECRDALERAEALGRRLALGWDDPIRLATCADLQFRMGDWDAALATAQTGLCRSVDRGSGFADVWIHTVVARIHLHRGCLDLAEDETARAEHAARAGATGIDRATTMRALCAEASGDLDAANATVRALWDELDRRAIAIKLLELSGDAARIARRCGDRELGATVVETTRQLASRCGETSAPAVAMRCRGLVDDDADLLARAAMMLRLRRRPVEQAWTEWEAATVCAAKGDRARSRRLFAAAARTLDPIDAPPLSIDRRDCGRTRSGDARFGWDSLTESERSVVERVAIGLSNAEIAEQLICSRRTVESHLHHVYTKLGMSSRVALAIEARGRLSA